MNFDLKGLRERKQLSQNELAKAMSAQWLTEHPNEPDHFSTDMIARMEREPDKISLDAMGTIIRVFGVTFDQLLKPTVPHLKVPPISNKWGELQSIRNRINELIANRNDRHHGGQGANALEQLGELMRYCARKPKIACIGRPDSGKSRTLNTLLGKDILPTNWTPTTSAFVLLKHIDDKPAFLGNHLVCVFKEDSVEPWDSERLDDEAYCDKWLLAKGDYSLLSKFGAHSEEEQLVGAIVAYVDSELLYNVDFIDLPGFNPVGSMTSEEDQVGTIDRDSMLSARASKMADAFIYLSIANSFMYSDDLSMAQTLIKGLPIIEQKGDARIPPFGNVFFVATQALAVDHGNAASLDRICNEAAKRLWNLIEDHPAIQEREKASGVTLSADILRTRFYTSEMESQELTDRFYRDLVACIEAFPSIQKEAMVKKFRKFCDDQIRHFTDEAHRTRLILEDQQRVNQGLILLTDSEPDRKAKYQRAVNQITDEIYRMKATSKTKCTNIYNEVVNSKHIVALVDKHGLKRNKKDMEQLVILLNAEIENKTTQVLAHETEKLKKLIEKFLGECQIIFKSVEFENSGNELVSAEGFQMAFDAGRAFAGGLSGLATFGALAAWAATCGNLGGYIIVTKVVSLLASMGIHIGGTAAAVTAVSAIGGPIVLGITAAVIAAVGAILALGGTWKKILGNKLIKQYEKKHVLENIIENSDKYWDDTLVAFRAGVAKIEEAWQNNLYDIRTKVQNYNIDGLKRIIAEAEKNAEFFRVVNMAIDN